MSLAAVRSFDPCGAMLLFGTILALVLGLSGVEPRALELVGMFWAAYGFIMGLLSGVLEPVVDRHPEDRSVRRLRRALEELKEERFGSQRRK